MNRFLLPHFPTHPFFVWTSLACKIGVTALASAQVIGYRLNRMVVAGPILSTKDRREFTLMGEEKVAAVTESAQAMATTMMVLTGKAQVQAYKQMLTANFANMSLVFSQTPAQFVARQIKLNRDTITYSDASTSQLSHSAARLINSGLKPFQSRVTGNAKRLAKKR